MDDTLNPDNSLGRHSGESRNPAIKNTPRSGQNHDVAPLTWGIFNHLDTGLRQHDTVFSNGLFGLKLQGERALLTDAVALAKQAGEEIMAVYCSGNTGATSKVDDSPLTLADLVSHRTIVAGLARLAPDIPILSEEGAHIPYVERGAWSRFWLVDPLDGTKEFIKRNGEFTVNIALIENGAPVLGVVYAPVLDVCYYAARGAGAFVQRGDAAAQPIRVKRIASGETIKVVASRSHSDERTQALLAKLGDYKCISMGSSLKLCLVAEGEAHFYPRLGPTMEWDTAAAHAVVNEAGGAVSDSSGTELHYNKQDLHNPEFFVRHAADTLLDGMIGA